MAASDCTWLLVLWVKAKVAIGAPVVRLRLATFCLAAPLTVLNEPPTNSLVPSGVASTAATPPLKVGRKFVSTRPVVRLYDARLAWLIVVVLPATVFCERGEAAGDEDAVQLRDDLDVPDLTGADPRGVVARRVRDEAVVARHRLVADAGPPPTSRWRCASWG